MLNKEERLAILSSIENNFPDTSEPVRNVPVSYALLRQACMQEELRQEREKLIALLSQEKYRHGELKRRFKQLCADRAKRNANTFMSLLALPEGACNRMYWEVACRIFKPNTLQALLTVLLPEVTQTWVLETQVIARRDAASHRIEDRVKLGLTLVDGLDVLAVHPPTVASLKRLIIFRAGFFDIAQVAALGLPLQIQFQTFLASDAHWQPLQKTLARHNDDFEMLDTDLTRLVQSGMTLNEVLTRCATQLKYAGSTYSGTQHALNSALYARDTFIGFIKRLPRLYRKAVMALKTQDGYRLSRILDDVREGRCVETAANNMLSLQANRANRRLLSKQFNVETARLRQALTTKYKGRQLALQGCDRATALPVALCTATLKNVQITTADHLLDFALNMPADEYSAVLSCMRVTGDVLKSDMLFYMETLGRQKSSALMDALFVQAEQGRVDRKELLAFCMRSYAAGLERAIKLFPEQNRLAAILAKDEQGDTVLHTLVNANRVDIVTDILNAIPEKDRLAVLVEKSSQGRTILHDAALIPNNNAVPMLISTIPAENRVAALGVKNNIDATILQYAALGGRLDVVQNTLAFVPEPDRLAAVTVKDRNGKCVLELIAGNRYGRVNAQYFNAMLMQLPPKDQLAAIRYVISNGETLLHAAAGAKNMALYMALFVRLSKGERLLFLLKKDNAGHASIQLLAPQIFASYARHMMKLLSIKDRLKFLLDDSVRHKIQHCSFASILVLLRRMLPKQYRLRALVGFYIPNSKLHQVLDILPRSHRIEALHQLNLWHHIDEVEQSSRRAKKTIAKFGGRQKVLHLAAQKSKDQVIFSILEDHCKDENERLVAMQGKDPDGNTLLHHAVAAAAPARAGQLMSYHVSLLLQCPMHMRLALLTEQNNKGETVYKLAEHNPKMQSDLCSLVLSSVRVCLYNKVVKRYYGTDELCMNDSNISGYGGVYAFESRLIDAAYFDAPNYNRRMKVVWDAVRLSVTEVDSLMPSDLQRIESTVLEQLRGRTAFDKFGLFAKEKLYAADRAIGSAVCFTHD